ncbi:unnamed protein product [Ilex paraguariensis]|uniref:Phytocyanin domain-containing protein n=1 Tax=Ilex paraguariensis TaxID=185542 RepID=A0ABC8QYG2_9AQUA
MCTLSGTHKVGYQTWIITLGLIAGLISWVISLFLTTTKAMPWPKWIDMVFVTCNATNAILYDNSRHTSVTLTKAGRHLFISDGPGDCNSGMEFPLDVT